MNMVNSGCHWVVKAVWTVRFMNCRRENYRAEPVFGHSLGRTGLAELQAVKCFPAHSDVILQEGEWNCSDQEGRVEITNRKPKNRQTLSFLLGSYPVELERGKEMQLEMSGDRWLRVIWWAKSSGSDLNRIAGFLHVELSPPSHSLGCPIPARKQAQAAPSWKEASRGTDEGWRLAAGIDRLVLSLAVKLKSASHWADMIRRCMSGSRAEACCQCDVPQHQFLEHPRIAVDCVSLVKEKESYGFPSSQCSLLRQASASAYGLRNPGQRVERLVVSLGLQGSNKSNNVQKRLSQMAGSKKGGKLPWFSPFYSYLRLTPTRRLLWILSIYLKYYEYSEINELKSPRKHSLLLLRAQYNIVTECFTQLQCQVLLLECLTSM